MRLACYRFALPTLLLAFGCFHAASAQSEPKRIEDVECGVAVTLPGGDWKLSDLSVSGAVVHLYSPVDPPVTRVTLLRLPKVYLPEGILSRARQIEASAPVERVRLGAAQMAGVDGEVYEYTAGGTRVFETAIPVDQSIVIVQVAARQADWEDTEKRGLLSTVVPSVTLLKGTGPVKKLRVDPKTPAEIRKLRGDEGGAPPRPFAVHLHDLSVHLSPSDRSVCVTDTLHIEALEAGISTLSFVLTSMKVDEVSSSDQPLKWSRPDQNSLEVALTRALEGGEKITLHFEAHLDDYNLSQDQTLVSEVAVYGQVLEASSFSSHVFYYPVELYNDAAMDITLTVPEGYTAVTGGEPQPVRESDGRRVFQYVTKARIPRALPFGFAAARYEKISGLTPGGVVLDFYFQSGKEKEARQRLEVAVTGGGLFEKLMGPLPWGRVAFCHVTPSRKATGVSLPGQVLFSDQYFADVEGVKLSGRNLSDPEGIGVLLIVDELSHQWNFYSVSLPNELAEGISTFTNLLYVGEREGRVEYDLGIDFCAQGYQASVATFEDVAIADPKLYLSEFYRTVAFLKVPAILDLLRRRLGDEVFFESWRKTFSELSGKPNGAYTPFFARFSEHADRDLGEFFDQWFYQAGYPSLEVAWSQKEGTLQLEITQTQPGGLYDLEPVFTVDCGDSGQHTVGPVTIEDRTTTWTQDVRGVVQSVRVDVAKTSPLLEIEIRARSGEDQ